MMDERDEDIDRVLRALGAAEPGAEMEARILQRLDSGCPMIAEAKPKLSWGWALWTAGALLMLVLAVVLLHGRKAVAPREARSFPAFSPTSVPQPVQVFSAPAARRDHSVLTAITVERKSATPVAPADRGAADLPSLLAPAAPLTEQERTLARIARGSGPDDFALLNPDTREKLAQQSQAEFNRMFPQPMDQETYVATHTPIHN